MAARSSRSRIQVENFTPSSSAGGPYTITFGGSHTGQNVASLLVDGASLTNANPLSVTEFTYDAADRLLSVTDPLGQVTAYTYDALDRLKTVTQPDPDGGGGPLTSPVTAYSYGAEKRG